jgi:methyl-accepting chemotaxis protein
VNDWSDIFLGVIALATLVLAVIQVGAILFAARLGLQLRELMASVQQDVRPLAAKAAGIAEDASRTAALAREQAEKIDRLMTDLSHRVDQTAAVVQEAIVTPAREGLAVVAAIKAGLGVLRSVRDYRTTSRRAEDEDALFIG